MFGSEDIKTERVTILGDPVGSGNAFYMMKAPGDLTVRSAYVVAENAQGVGTAVLLALQNWGTAGTAVEGTIAAAVGGTAAASELSARTPVAATVDPDHAYVSDGEWLVVYETEEGTGWISGDIFTYVVEYTLGRVQGAT